MGTRTSTIEQPCFTTRRILALVASISLSSCSVSESDLYTMTDSLGVTVVTYRSSFDSAPGSTWSLDTQPQLIVGDPTAQLFRVRAARFQSNGRFVIADGGSRELLLYGVQGGLLSRVGGEGEGPGEFSMISDLSVGPGDSIYVYDGRTRRLSVFGEAGTFARSLMIEGVELGRATDVRVLSSGQMIGAFHRRTEGTGLVRDSLMIVRFNLEGHVVDTVGTFPHMFTHWGPHAFPGEPGPVAMAAPVPLSPLTILGAGHGTLYVGLADRYELIRIAGDDNRILTRHDRGLPPITQEHRDQLFTRLAAGGRSGPEEELLRDLTGPETLPAFGDEPLTQGPDDALIVTDVGGIWVRPFRLDDSTGSEWRRFGSDGQYQGVVSIPAGFMPTDVRGELALGVYTDSLDVESVRSYRISGES